MIRDLILRHRVTRGRSKNAVNRTTVIPQVEQLCLDSLNRGAICWAYVVSGAVVIIRINVGVVIVWVEPTALRPPAARCLREMRPKQNGSVAG